MRMRKKDKDEPAATPSSRLPALPIILPQATRENWERLIDLRG